MVQTLLTVVFVLVAIAMIVLILLQRGAGAQAGSGFGAGASGTVFGSRGSANFLSSTTKWLAAVFFSLSLFMAWQTSREAKAPGPNAQDIGVMSQLPADAKAPANSTKPATPDFGLPAPAPASTAPAIQAPVIAPAPAPAAPASTAPASAPPSSDNPTSGGKGG